MKQLFTIPVLIILIINVAEAQLFKLVGMTAYSDDGSVFSINEDGSSPEQWVNFDGSNGSNPNGSLIESNGKLWGITIGGGANGEGVIFHIDFDGSNYRKVHDFDGINGANPRDNLAESNGKLWGVTEQGGTCDKGVIFNMDLDGSNYTKIHDFEGANGSLPRGSLVESNGKLWGTTSHGGATLNGELIILSNQAPVRNTHVGHTKWTKMESGSIHLTSEDVTDGTRTVPV